MSTEISFLFIDFNFANNLPMKVVKLAETN